MSDETEKKTDPIIFEMESPELEAAFRGACALYASFTELDDVNAWEFMASRNAAAKLGALLLWREDTTHKDRPVIVYVKPEE